MGIWESIVFFFEKVVLFSVMLILSIPVLIKLEFPNVKMITGDDLTDYHAVGEVWQESYCLDEENQGHPDAVFEFQCLEATDKYIKLNIKLVEVSDELKGKDINFKLTYPYWKKVIREDGKEYQSDSDEVVTAWAMYEAIPIDEKGITLYMYYSFRTKIPAGYLQAQIYRCTNVSTFEIGIAPHE